MAAAKPQHLLCWGFVRRGPMGQYHDNTILNLQASLCPFNLGRTYCSNAARAKSNPIARWCTIRQWAKPAKPFWAIIHVLPPNTN